MAKVLTRATTLLLPKVGNKPVLSGLFEADRIRRIGQGAPTPPQQQRTRALAGTQPVKAKAAADGEH
jgi:hypothetical protein